jgi:hypothetical protein
VEVSFPRWLHHLQVRIRPIGWAHFSCLVAVIGLPTQRLMDSAINASAAVLLTTAF